MLPFLFVRHGVYLNTVLALIIIISSLYFLQQMYSKKYPMSEYLDQRDFLFLTLLLIIPTVISVVHINDYSIWLDEAQESQNVLNFSDILNQASHFQQPPLGYFFRKFGLIIGGVTETGLRLGSVFGNTLFLNVMYLNIKKITKNSFFSFLCTLLLSLNTWIIIYSVEARPYSISLFYFSVFCYFFLEDVLKSSIPSGKKINFNLAFAAFFWLMSISMQPIIFICCLLVCLLLKILNDRDFRFLKSFTSILIGLALFLPFLDQIVKNSLPYVRKDIVLNAHFVLKIIENLKIAAGMLLQNVYYNIIISGFFGSIILGLILSKQRKTIFQSLVLSGGFLAANIILFTVKIDWYFAPRYALTFVPLFYLLALASLYFSSDERKALYRSFSLLVFVGLALASYFQFRPVKVYRTDWRSLYAHLKKSTPLSGDAYIFSFHQAGTWNDGFFVANEFYETPQVQILGIDNLNSPLRLNNDYLAEQFDQQRPALDSHHFVIMKYTLSAHDFDSIEIANTEKFRFDDFYLISTQKGQSLQNFAKSFFLQLDLRMTNRSRIINVDDGLFLVSMYEKNCENAKKYLIKFETDAVPFKQVYQLRLDHHKIRFEKMCNFKS